MRTHILTHARRVLVVAVVALTAVAAACSDSPTAPTAPTASSRQGTVSGVAKSQPGNAGAAHRRSGYNVVAD